MPHSSAETGPNGTDLQSEIVERFERLEERLSDIEKTLEAVQPDVVRSVNAAEKAAESAEKAAEKAIETARVVADLAIDVKRAIKDFRSEVEILSGAATSAQAELQEGLRYIQGAYAKIEELTRPILSQRQTPVPPALAENTSESEPPRDTDESEL